MITVSVLAKNGVKNKDPEDIAINPQRIISIADDKNGNASLLYIEFYFATNTYTVDISSKQIMSITPDVDWIESFVVVPTKENKTIYFNEDYVVDITGSKIMSGANLTDGYVFEVATGKELMKYLVIQTYPGSVYKLITEADSLLFITEADSLKIITQVD